MLGPKPSERSAGPQFKHLRALIGGDVDRPLEGGFGLLASVVGRIEQQQFAALAFEFGIAPALQSSLSDLASLRLRF